MLILAPVILLLIAAVILIILHWQRPGFGLAWLISTGSTLIAWLLVMFLRLRLPDIITIAQWHPYTLFLESPQFILDRISWPYLFSLAILAFGVLLTATARARDRSNPLDWAGTLAMIALGMLAVMAANPLTLMMAWVAIDIVEFIILLSTLNDVQVARRSVVSFAARIGGTIFLVWVVISNPGLPGNLQYNLDLSHIPDRASIFIILSVGLRLGVFPLHLPFSQEPRLRRGLGSVMRLVPLASSLVLLGRLSGEVVSQQWKPYLSGLAILAALYCGIMWLISKDELTGRPFWLIGWASLSLICAINGLAAFSIAWGVVAILPGGLLFLFSAREKQLLFLPALALLGLSGLPFTPAASGWQGLVGKQFSVGSLFAILAHAFFLLGYARHALRPGDTMSKVERWARFTYPLGLLILVAGDIILGIWGWPGSRTVGIWWVELISAGVISGMIIVYIRYYETLKKSPVTGFFSSFTSILILRRAARYIMDFLRLDWLYQLLSWTYQGVGFVLGGVISILEGDGGVLWALVIVSLLLSLIIHGGLL